MLRGGGVKQKNQQNVDFLLSKYQLLAKVPYVEVCQLSIGTNVPKDPDQMSAHAQSNERTKNLELYSSAHFRLSMTEVIDW